MRLATLGVVRLPNHSIQTMAAMLAEYGLDPYLAADAAELPHALLDSRNAGVTGQQELAYQRAFFRQTATQPDLWIELGRRYRILSHAHPSYCLAIATAENIQESIVIGNRLRDLHFTLAEGLCVFEGERLAGVRCMHGEVPDDMRRFLALRDLAAACTVFDDLWGGRFPLASIELPLSRDDEALVGTIAPFESIRFGGVHTAFWWDADLRDHPVAQANGILSRYYRSECDALILAARNSRDVVSLLFNYMDQCDGPPTLAAAADTLHLAPRTLQRALRKAEMTFRDVHHTFLHQKGCKLLIETDQSINQISWTLGYDSASSFSYAFRRKSGMSPRQYRQKNARNYSLTH